MAGAEAYSGIDSAIENRRAACQTLIARSCCRGKAARKFLRINGVPQIAKPVQGRFLVLLV